jgi:Fe-S-cluster-containing dehydrogenase component
MQTAISEAIRVHSDRCHGCLTCAYRCSLRVGGAFNPARANIRIDRVQGSYDYRHAFTDQCDGCEGEFLCVRWCPYGALTLERS